nr:serine carboxypeptidase-like 1 [Quercus suber]
MSTITWLFIVYFLAFANAVASQSESSIINRLPGFSGDLPFKLETGYIGVGKSDEVQLFFYFIESERSPEDDPLVLWLTGGPGCSAFSGLVYEVGPLSFDYERSKSNSPKLKLNPYSWTKVGTGFSYAKSLEGYNTSDTLAAAELYEFLLKWLKLHPKFLTNSLYIMGDSYSGIIIPILVQKISDGNEVGQEPRMNPKRICDQKPKELYESAKNNCKGEYRNVDPSNAACVDDLNIFTECPVKIFTAQILEPDCQYLSPKPRPSVSNWDPDTLIEDPVDLLQSITHLPEPTRWCRGSISEWVRCNKSLVYTYDISSSLNYHRNLIKKGYQVLIYSGDHDMVIPYIATHAWIVSLNLTIAHDWRPWFVDGQVARFTMQYTSKKYCLTFAIVKARISN